MLHRLCPHPIYCNLRLVQYVFQKWGNFPTPASVPPAAGEPQTEAEKKVAEMLFELVDYAMLIKSEVARESLAEVSAHPLEVTWVKAVDKLVRGYTLFDLVYCRKLQGLICPPGTSSIHTSGGRKSSWGSTTSTGPCPKLSACDFLPMSWVPLRLPQPVSPVL